MGWGHNYTLIHFKKTHDDEWDATYISIKDFYNKYEQQIAELTSILPFPDLISGIIVQYVIPTQYSGIYVLKETEWRSDVSRTVTGLSKCFMYPDYSYIMLLTLKSSLKPFNDSLYYTVIQGTWELRTDQENFKDWVDPIQDYINALGPWRPGDDPPQSIKSAEHLRGFVAYQFNNTPENEHPKAQRQFMMNQEKEHHEKIDANHILFQIDKIKMLQASCSTTEEESQFENEDDKLAFQVKKVSESFDKLRTMQWKDVETKSGKKKIIDWNCAHLDLANVHGGIKARCGGGCFGPRNPNWCENPVYSVRKKLWRKCILGTNTGKSYWDTGEDVNDPYEIIMDNDMIDID